MGIYLDGLHICMAEQFLEDADVDPVLQHMGSKTVAQGMAADLLVEPCLLCGSFHRLLQAGFEHMMAHLPARARVQRARTGRKHPMPAGLPRGLWVFPRKRFGNVHCSKSRFKVLVMEGFHRLDLLLQRFPQVSRQDGRPVLTSLAAPDKDEV